MSKLRRALWWFSSVAPLLAWILIWRSERSRHNHPQHSQHDALQTQVTAIDVLAPTAVIQVRWRFDYKDFATDPKHFRTWVDHLFSRAPLPIPVTATVVAILVFVGGLVIALFIGFEKGYLQ